MNSLTSAWPTGIWRVGEDVMAERTTRVERHAQNSRRQFTPIVLIAAYPAFSNPGFGGRSDSPCRRRRSRTKMPAASNSCA